MPSSLPVAIEHICTLLKKFSVFSLELNLFVPPYFQNFQEDIAYVHFILVTVQNPVPCTYVLSKGNGIVVTLSANYPFKDHFKIIP